MKIVSVAIPAKTLAGSGSGVVLDSSREDQPPAAATGPSRATPYQAATARMPVDVEAIVTDATVNATAVAARLILRLTDRAVRETKADSTASIISALIMRVDVACRRWVVVALV